MLAVFCMCPEKISVFPPQVIYNPTTIQVLCLFIFTTSTSTLVAPKGPISHPDQPMATTPILMPSKHTDQPLVSSVGAGYHHIHPSDVPVKNLPPLLLKTRSSMKTSPQQRGKKLAKARGTQFKFLTRNIQTCKPLSSVGAGYLHIHPSDVPVKTNFPPLLLNETHLNMKTSPQQRGNKLGRVRGTKFRVSTRIIQMCKPLSSAGAGYHHIHPSDVPVKILPPLLLETRLRMKTLPQLRANKLAEACDIQFELSSYSLYLSHTNSEPRLYSPPCERKHSSHNCNGSRNIHKLFSATVMATNSYLPTFPFFHSVPLPHQSLSSVPPLPRPSR
jgi:hypothetical protein